MPGERLPDEIVAMRAAKEFMEGHVVNLGVGIPTLCSSFLPPGRDIIFHSENGIVGFGEIITDPEKADPALINASVQPVAYKPGMSIVDHAESFAIIRGGWIDVTVLGALQVSARGDLANNTVPGKLIGSYGGGQDLAYNAKRVIVCMTHTTKEGVPKIVNRCTSPITATQCVDLIVTDVAVIEVKPDGLLLREIVPGWTPEEVQEITEPALIIGPDLKEMELL